MQALSSFASARETKDIHPSAVARMMVLFRLTLLNRSRRRRV
jgi:hypothetical protein